MEKKKKFVALYSAINEWTVPIEAESEEDAFEMAEDVLDDLYEEGPFDYCEDVSIDIYEVEDDAEPELDDELDSLMNLLHLIRNAKETSDRRLAKMLWDGMNRVWGED